MFEAEDVQPLTAFQRNAKSQIKRLRKSGRPSILTINGRAEVVVQDAKAYQALLEKARRQDEYEAVRAAIAELEAGKGRPFSEFAAELRAKHVNPPRRRRSA